MDRLTIRNSDGSVSQPTDLRWVEVLYKLAAYEDTGLSPEEVEATKAALAGKILAKIKELNGISVERMIELAKADVEGRLIVLPCNVGDTVYALERFCDGSIGDCDSWVKCEECEDYQQEVSERRIGTLAQAVSVIEMLGKTVFLTREEAEKALEAEK